jgi:hypothetical protein
MLSPCYKWASNKTSRNICRAVSDDLCRANGLSVIGESYIPETNNITIDTTTKVLTKQGKSWKAELVKLLDYAIINCKTKLDFIDFLNKNGYLVKYQKHITFQKVGEKKSIRADTLAKQYGEKYTKDNLEKAMGFYQNLPSEKENVDIPKVTPKDVKCDYSKSEFARFERHLFEHIKNERQKERFQQFLSYEDNSHHYQNISIISLLNSVGANTNANINLLDLVKLENADFYFFARKLENKPFAKVYVKAWDFPKLQNRISVLAEIEEVFTVTASADKRSKCKMPIPHKKKNAPKLEILSEIDEILGTNLAGDNTPKSTTQQQKFAKLNGIAKSRGVKLSYLNVTQKQLEMLQKSEIEFSHRKLLDGNYTVSFLPENLECVKKTIAVDEINTKKKTQSAVLGM